jgi:hypothetical protein
MEDENNFNPLGSRKSFSLIAVHTVSGWMMEYLTSSWWKQYWRLVWTAHKLFASCCDCEWVVCSFLMCTFLCHHMQIDWCMHLIFKEIKITCMIKMKNYKFIPTIRSQLNQSVKWLSMICLTWVQCLAWTRIPSFPTYPDEFWTNW